jgi:glucose-6-phosphate isomerase
MKLIHTPQVLFAGASLKGDKIEHQKRTLKDLEGLFDDQGAYQRADKATEVYTVESYLPVGQGTEGGLFFGITHIQPGRVGNEYFMTKGHGHQIQNRAEFYWCIEGEGMLILMDEMRNTWAEQMTPGSLHYIQGNTAHRVANTGEQVLSFGACWPSDAGYNYELIAEKGFSKRLMRVEGKAVLV